MRVGSKVSGLGFIGGLDLGLAFRVRGLGSRVLAVMGLEGSQRPKPQNPGMGTPTPLRV